jgi:hypothetical protein
MHRPLPRIRHGHEHPFGRVISLRGKGLQPCVRPYLHGMDASRQQTHSFEWGIPCQTTILWFAVASAAEAELGPLYHNCQNGIIFRLTLADMGHPQPKTPVHCDNATAVGIANNTIKRQRSRSMEMRFFWVGDKVAQGMYKLS